MFDPTQIPKPIIDLATQATSKSAASFSEFVSLKLFGKTNARLRAEAENEYEKIKQAGVIEREAQKPFIVQMETRKAFRQYSNLGSALIKANSLITAPESKITDDNDVFWGLLEHSKEISNEEMQELIAKIIAGEYNVPGTYSMSTLQTIKMLGKKELELFEFVCGLIISEEYIPQELFLDIKEFMKEEMKIDFGSLQTLQSLGLFLPNGMTKTIINSEKENFEIIYFDKKILFSPDNENYLKIKLPPLFGLSMVGNQILKHLKPKYNEAYFIWLKENFKIKNYKIIDSAK
ncbi:MAG: hypothetical protein YFSK_2610 [Candidatus Yanofskyibacterium parasiticum]|nr:MAG: hypothetical protein YFSK_2610 [Candidatus Yanofskybacteria bacterium]